MRATIKGMTMKRWPSESSYCEMCRGPRWGKGAHEEAVKGCGGGGVWSPARREKADGV